MFYYIYITNFQVMQKLIIYMSVTYFQRKNQQTKKQIFFLNESDFQQGQIVLGVPSVTLSLLCASQFVTLMMCLNLCKNNLYNCSLHTQLLVKFWKICYYIFLALQEYILFWQLVIQGCRKFIILFFNPVAIVIRNELVDTISGSWICRDIASFSIVLIPPRHTSTH